MNVGPLVTVSISSVCGNVGVTPGRNPSGAVGLQNYPASPYFSPQPAPKAPSPYFGTNPTQNRNRDYLTTNPYDPNSIYNAGRPDLFRSLTRRAEDAARLHAQKHGSHAR
jgi:hypothetical protein